MLVFRDALPTSTGFLSCRDVNSSPKPFFPSFHWPDSFCSVTVTSFVFWVWIGFMSAADAASAPAIVRIPSESATIRPLSMLSSLCWLIGRPHRRPVVGSFASARLGLGAAEVALAQPVEDHRCHDQHEAERADHAAEHPRRKRLHDLGAGRVAPHARQEASEHGGDGPDLRA